MAEEMPMVSMYLDGQQLEMTLPDVRPPGFGNTRFWTQTGEDFSQCDVIGKIYKIAMIC